jgi:hypothetical protein
MEAVWRALCGITIAVTLMAFAQMFRAMMSGAASL